MRSRVISLAMALALVLTGPSWQNNMMGATANSFVPGNIALGVYTGDGNTLKADLADVENQLGKKFAIVHVYTGFNQEFSTFQQYKLAPASRPDSITLVSWAPGVAKGQLYSEIAKGSVDPYIHRWAKGAKAWGKPLMVRFGYEMNMVNMGWNAASEKGGKNGTPQDFISAWRHIHDIFQEEGASNVVWVWCPHADQKSPNYTDVVQYYPGSDVVDWIGLDGYYWGGAQGKEADSFDWIFKASYDQLKHYQKPMMIAEMGAPAEDGAHPAEWLKAAYEKIQTSYPQIKAVVAFNMDFSHRGEKDWRFSQRADTRNAMQQVMAQSAYTASAVDVLEQTHKAQTIAVAIP